MRTRLTAFAALAVGVVGIAATGATAGRTATKTLVGHMTGGVETPKGDASGKGTVTVTLNTATGRVCWKFAIAKIDGKPTAAHIHKGGKGVAGAVVVPFGTAYRASGCTKASPSLLKAIVARPGAYYVNVHNAKHPAGAIRSQLSAM